jgi:hypothetical protein
MKIVIASALAPGLLAVCLVVVCLAKDHAGDWPVREQENIQKTFALSEPPMRLVVDNVDGYVHVKGVAGSEVRVTAHKTIRAETESDLAQARSEVKLDLTEQPGSVSVYYDAPWRCNGKGAGCQGSQRHFYDVSYDIEVEVPMAARLAISTVNGGEIRIDQSSGDYEVSDINGGIHMSGISGSGSVHTINGPVSVHFTKNPAAKCSFKSINGSLDVWLQQALSADLLFKTFNGQVYSDFEVAPRAIAASAVSERRDGMFVYRSSGMSGGRVGQGGPELSFDTLNGSVRLHRGE